MMKYWKLYRRNILWFFIAFSVYILYISLILFALKKNSDINRIVHEFFNSILTGILVSLLISAFSGKDYFQNELYLLMLLPVKRINIVINQFIRYMIIVTIPILTFSLVTFLLFHKSSLNMNQFIDEVLKYLFICINTVIVIQPLYIWISSKNRHNVYIYISVTFIYFLIIALMGAILIFSLNLESSIKGYTFFYNSLLIKNIVISIVYTLLILILSFFTTYKLLLKKEF